MKSQDSESSYVVASILSFVHDIIDSRARKHTITTITDYYSVFCCSKKKHRKDGSFIFILLYLRRPVCVRLHIMNSDNSNIKPRELNVFEEPENRRTLHYYFLLLMNGQWKIKMKVNCLANT